MNENQATKIMQEWMNNEKEIEHSLFYQVLEKCSLEIENQEGWNVLMYIMCFNKSKKLQLNEKQWNYLIQNSNLKHKNKEGWNSLMYAICFNEERSLQLTNEQWDYFIRHSDLKLQNNEGRNAIQYVLKYYQEQKINWTEQQWDYLIQHSDLKQKDDDGWNSLMYAFMYAQEFIFSWKKEQWIYLIEHSDLKYRNKENWTACSIFVKFSNLYFSKDILQYLWSELNEEEKNKIFQKYVQKTKKEEIIWMLYDMNLQLHEKIMIWLQEEKNQEILKMIEKKDIFYNLNKNLSKEKERKNLLKM
jgi:hypothetical protein